MNRDRSLQRRMISLVAVMFRLKLRQVDHAAHAVSLLNLVFLYGSLELGERLLLRAHGLLQSRHHGLLLLDRIIFALVMHLLRLRIIHILVVISGFVALHTVGYLCRQHLL